MAPTLMTPDGLSAGPQLRLDEPHAGHAGWAPDTVVWVYAITHQLGPGRLTGLTGVGGEPGTFLRAPAPGRKPPRVVAMSWVP